MCVCASDSLAGTGLESGMEVVRYSLQPQITHSLVQRGFLVLSPGNEYLYNHVLVLH